ILGSRCAVLLCRIWRLSIAPGAAQVRDQRSRCMTGVGIGGKRQPDTTRELAVTAHPEEERTLAHLQIARNGAHALPVLDYTAHGFDLARRRVPELAHRTHPWRKRCSDAVMPKCARNARAKL